MRLENNQKNFVFCLLTALTIGVAQARAGTIGQIWFAGEGPAVTTNSVTDDRVARINVDGSGLGTALASANSNAFLNVQLDTNADLFFALSADGKLTSGHMSSSALPHVYSGVGLSGLNYVGNPGDAQYVAGNPDVAELFTKDAGLLPPHPISDSPAVFIPGPFGTLSSFSATYALQSSAIPSGLAPYWVLWVSPPNDSNPNDEVKIYQFSVGPTLNSNSTIHVYDPTGKLGTYFGTNFSALINTSVGAYKFGDMTVDWAGVEIGNWGIPATNSAKAAISSMTLTFVPISTLDTIQITDNAANDLAYAMAVDPLRDIIYIGLWGADPNGADMIEVTYNPLTGVMTSPYDPNTGTVTDTSHVLMDFLGTGLNFVMARQMWVTPDGGQIYYVDNDFGDPGDFADQIQLNGVYVVTTTTDSQPIPQQLSDPNQFPGDDSQGYIVGLAVNPPQNLIYFVTSGPTPGVGVAFNTIWSMPITGGTATAMPMPSGLSLVYPNDTGGCLALDADNQILYVSDEGQGKVLKLALSSKGTNFTSGSVFYTLDSNHLKDGPNQFPSAFVHGMTFTTSSVATPPPASPELTIVRQGTNALVSWPVQFSEFNLQSAPAMGSAGWTNYPGPFVTNAASVMVTDPIAGKAHFFRLSE